MSACWTVEVDWRQTVVQEDRSFRWGRIGEDYVAEWINVVAIRMNSAGLVTMVLPDPGARPERVEKTLRGEGAAFVRHLDGRFSLHASAVALSGKAVVLTGVSGAGKSTAAHRLCASMGAELLADDVAGFARRRDSLCVEPSELSIWLDDAAGAKSPVCMRSAPGPSELAAIVSLRMDAAAERPLLVRLRGAATLKCVLDGLIRFDVAPEPRSREFDALIDLATAVPVWQLIRPAADSREQVAKLLAQIVQMDRASLPGASA